MVDCSQSSYSRNADKDDSPKTETTNMTSGPEDSLYKSPSAEAKGWEMVLEMATQDHENNVAALKDVHDDEVKDLKSRLASMTARKELLEKRVKKEVLAKQDAQQRISTMEEDQRPLLQDLDRMNQEARNQGDQIIALRHRTHEMTKELFEKETLCQTQLLTRRAEAATQADTIRNLAEELRRRSGVAVHDSVGIIGQKPAASAAGPWEAWYHDSFQEVQHLRGELARVNQAYEEASALSAEYGAQREHWAMKAHAANEATFQEELETANVQQSWEDADSEIKTLRERSHRAEMEVANLRTMKANQAQDAAANISALKDLLKGKDTTIDVLVDSKASWESNSTRIMRALASGVTRDKVIDNLVNHANTLSNDNETLAAQNSMQESQIKALQHEKRQAANATVDLQDSMAETAAAITQLEGEKGELDIRVGDLEWKLETATEEKWQLELLVEELHQKINEGDTAIQDLVASGPEAQAQWVIGRKDQSIEKLNMALEECHRQLTDLSVEHSDCAQKQFFSADGYHRMLYDAGRTEDFRQQVQELEEKLERLESTSKVRELRTLKQRLAEAEMTVEGLQRELRDVGSEEEVSKLRAATLNQSRRARQTVMHIRALDEKVQSEQSKSADLQEKLTREQAKAYEDTQRFLSFVKQKSASNERHIALIRRLYERVLKLEATLEATGKEIVEDEEERNELVQECQQYYDEGSSDDDEATKRPAASQADFDSLYDDEFTYLSEGQVVKETAESVDDIIGPPTVVAHAIADQSSVPTDYSAPSEVAASPSPSEAKIPLDIEVDDREDVASIASTDAGIEAEELRKDPLPPRSRQWVQKHSPFRYGELLDDDQFGHMPSLCRF